MDANCKYMILLWKIFEILVWILGVLMTKCLLFWLILLWVMWSGTPSRKEEEKRESGSEGIRTLDHPVMSRALHLAELRTLFFQFALNINICCGVVRKESIRKRSFSHAFMLFFPEITFSLFSPFSYISTNSSSGLRNSWMHLRTA